ncbi:ABC transporter ATP-binding protein [Acidaminobacter hydrogenoformans]|uniref:ABC transporter n=1 Tax=Acidaminobacter hydrogenoformans DSM 2784 TaxID=1120920 RepID=A0A1G5RZ97_9FIRM|nr:ABC transporter ATP-binding protein [Acidaminobacter hydrogenoformans]SCZ79465.1 ABC transporter [Acidaminobacter hydrogenoformans DSM 2784]
MSYISLENITTPYCLENVNLNIEAGEIMAVLGFTGAGKSTLLNVIAGLTEYKGDVYFNQNNMNHIRTERRNVGYLLQDIYLFPHLNTFDNIAFGLRAGGYPDDEIKEKIDSILHLLNITHLKKRYPKDLSGGEKQRVGLARSIIIEPKILLLDEPLSSLDPSTARSIRKELKVLQKRLNLTILYVTHDFAEAKELADRIVVITEGQIKQLGSVHDIFNLPAEEIREFISAAISV